MKAFLGLIVCVAIGFGIYWFMTDGRNRRTVRDTQETLAEGTHKLKESIQEGVKEIRADEIKDELARSGRVVRQKAKQVGAAIANAADNARITTAIKTRLIAEPQLSALTINVDTTDGLVTLSGTVSSHDQIARAMQIALDTDGVHQVISTLQLKLSK